MEKITNIIQSKTEPKKQNLWFKDGSLLKYTSKGWEPISGAGGIKTGTYEEMLKTKGLDGEMFLTQEKLPSKEAVFDMIASNPNLEAYTTIILGTVDEGYSVTPSNAKEYLDYIASTMLSIHRTKQFIRVSGELLLKALHAGELFPFQEDQNAVQWVDSRKSHDFLIDANGCNIIIDTTTQECMCAIGTVLTPQYTTEYCMANSIPLRIFANEYLQLADVTAMEEALTEMVESPVVISNWNVTVKITDGIVIPASDGSTIQTLYTNINDQWVTSTLTITGTEEDRQSLKLEKGTSVLFIQDNGEIFVSKKYKWINISSEYIDCTYNELATLKDNNQLQIGKTYRITDYKCTGNFQEFTAIGVDCVPLFILLKAVSTNSFELYGTAVNKLNGDSYKIKFEFINIESESHGCRHIAFARSKIYNLYNNSTYTGSMCVGQGKVFHSRSNDLTSVHIYDMTNDVDLGIKSVPYGNRIFYVPEFDKFISISPGTNSESPAKMGWSSDGLTWNKVENCPADFVTDMRAHGQYQIQEGKCYLLGENYMGYSENGITWEFISINEFCDGKESNGSYPFTRMCQLNPGNYGYLFHLKDNNFLYGADKWNKTVYTLDEALVPLGSNMAIACGQEKYVMVTDANVCLVCEGAAWEASYWKAYPMPKDYNGGEFQMCVYWRGMFIGQNTKNEMWYSFDGITWSQYASNDIPACMQQSIIYEDLLYLHAPELIGASYYNIFECQQRGSVYKGIALYRGNITYMEDTHNNKLTYDFENTLLSNGEDYVWTFSNSKYRKLQPINCQIDGIHGDRCYLTAGDACYQIQNMKIDARNSGSITGYLDNTHIGYGVEGYGDLDIPAHSGYLHIIDSSKESTLDINTPQT